MKKCQTCKKFLSKTEFYGGGEYPRCKLCDKKAQKKFKTNNPDGFRISSHKKRIKYSYGLEYEDYLKMLIDQDYKCLVCESLIKDRRLCIDHDHITGKVRGLLCNDCNRGLGLLKDNPIITQKATDYLLRSVTH